MLKTSKTLNVFKSTLDHTPQHTEKSAPPWASPSQKNGIATDLASQAEYLPVTLPSGPWTCVIFQMCSGSTCFSSRLPLSKSVTSHVDSWNSFLTHPPTFPLASLPIHSPDRSQGHLSKTLMKWYPSHALKPSGPFHDNQNKIRILPILTPCPKLLHYTVQSPRNRMRWPLSSCLTPCLLSLFSSPAFSLLFLEQRRCAVSNTFSTNWSGTKYHHSYETNRQFARCLHIHAGPFGGIIIL